jgi:hypothetical protein
MPTNTSNTRHTTQYSSSSDKCLMCNHRLKIERGKVMQNAQPLITKICQSRHLMCHQLSGEHAHTTCTEAAVHGSRHKDSIHGREFDQSKLMVVVGLRKNIRDFTRNFIPQSQWVRIEGVLRKHHLIATQHAIITHSKQYTHHKLEGGVG